METIATISIEEVGAVTGKSYSGEFKVRNVVSMRQVLEADGLRRELLGLNPSMASPVANKLATYASDLYIMIVEAPEWWKSLGEGGIDIQDANVLEAIHAKTVESQAQYMARVRDSLQEQAAKAAEQLKEKDKKEKIIMLNEELVRALQILAIKSAEIPDFQDVYRRICRWYSEKYSTPLVQVEDMDQFYVLRHYLEDSYQKSYSSDDDKTFALYEAERNKILYPEEYQRQVQNDDDWINELKAKVAKENEKPEETQQPNQSQASEKHNLGDIPEDLKLPDSGSLKE